MTFDSKIFIAIIPIFIYTMQRQTISSATTTFIHTYLSNSIHVWGRTVTFAISFFLIMACSGGSPACPSLLEQLDNYMNLNDCRTYGIFLTNEEGLTYIEICGSYLYNKVLTDGYFFRNDKLVTYSFVDNKIQDSIIYRKNTETFTGDIKGYKSFDPYSCDSNDEPPAPKYLIAFSADSILPEDAVHVKAKRKHLVNGNNVVRHKVLNDSINSFINNTTGPMTMLRIAKKDDCFCYTIRSQDTYCKEHTRGYFLRDGHPVVIYLDEKQMDLDISSIIDVRELKSCETGIGNYRDYPDFFYFFNWGYKIVGNKIEIMPREENNPPVL